MPKTYPAMSFTEARLRAITPPASGRDFYRDSASPLLAMMTPTGSVSLIVRRRVSGRPRTIRLASWPDVTVEAARKLARQTMAEIGTGADPTARAERKRVAEAAAYTFGQAVGDYLADRKSKLKASTLREYRRLADTNLKPLAGKPLSGITGDALLKLHHKITSANGAGAANAAARVARATVNYALKRARIERSPFVAMRGEMNRLKPRDGFIAEADLGRFLLALDDARGDTRDAGIRTGSDALLLAVLYGLRIGEVLNLRGDAVDLAAGTFKVTGTKNGSDLALPITRVARPMFLRRLADAESVGSVYIHPTGGNRPSKSGRLREPRHAIRAVTEATGLSFTPHDLRRSFAGLAARHLPYAMLKAVVNHKATDKGDVTLTHYVRVTAEDMRRPLDDLHDHVWSLKASASGLKLVGVAAAG